MEAADEACGPGPHRRFDPPATHDCRLTRRSHRRAAHYPKLAPASFSQALARGPICARRPPPTRPPVPVISARRECGTGIPLVGKKKSPFAPTALWGLQPPPSRRRSARRPAAPGLNGVITRGPRGGGAAAARGGAAERATIVSVKKSLATTWCIKRLGRHHGGSPLRPRTPQPPSQPTWQAFAPVVGS